METIKKINIDKIPEAEHLKTLNNKRYINFVVPFIIGFLMLFGSWLLKAFGIIFVAYTIFVFVKFKDRTVADVYKEFLVVYDPEDANLATVIPWDEMKSWDMKVSQTQEDSIFVETKDNEVIVINMFGIGRLGQYFRKFVFDKNKNEIYKRKQNARGSSFNIGGLFNKGTKGED